MTQEVKRAKTIPIVEVGTTEQALYEVRRKIHPRSVQGLYANLRWFFVWFTQIIFYGLPWLQWNDRQAVLFDLGARKFYLFGLVLWPQDIIYLALLLIASALALFLFTAVAGRLFCGYACPQTVYTEIFMWIEKVVEGDRFARLRLDASPWNARKIRLRFTKHVLWVAVALWTGFTFIGYFSPIRPLIGEALSGSLGFWQIFWWGFYSFATWGNAGFMREQVCKYMCPYARFQSVMVDNDTYVVTYDPVRGEPRGSRSRKEDHRAAGKGDCVDCSICVQVCPTGIDIRQGLQVECIGCGLCVDACDQVMDKMNYPRGLISYSTERTIQDRTSKSEARRRVLRPRVLIYSVLLLAVTGVLFGSLFTRDALRFDVIRDRTVLAREIEGGNIENVYRLQLMNTTESEMLVKVSAEGLTSLKVRSSNNGDGDHIEVMVSAASNSMLPLRVEHPVDGLEPGSHPIHFVIESSWPGGRETVREASSFIVPR